MTLQDAARKRACDKGRTLEETNSNKKTGKKILETREEEEEIINRRLNEQHVPILYIA